VRVMDAQSQVADTAALVALVQSLARLELEGGPGGSHATPEVLAENSFLAARDGVDAGVVDPMRGTLVPLRAMVAALVAECRSHAEALGCADLLDDVRRLARVNGAVRQRRRAEALANLSSVVATLADDFAPLT
jgi:glutamate---cysteine ligase / carboxylate-amine ligase